MKLNNILLLLSVCLLQVMSSCVTSRQTDLLQDISQKYPKITNAGEYKIISGDELSITVQSLDPEINTLFVGYSPIGLTVSSSNMDTWANIWTVRNTEMNMNVKPVKVYSDGTITFPYIGKIYVQDLTISEARRIISQKLNEFAEGTSADVKLYNTYFSILGEVGPQRVLMPKGKINIYEALTLANNLGEYADRSKITILRQTKDGTDVKTFDLRSKDIIDTDFYYVQANDVLYVPQMKRKFLGGTNSFVGIFGLLSSLAGLITFAVRLF